MSRRCCGIATVKAEGRRVGRWSALGDVDFPGRMQAPQNAKSPLSSHHGTEGALSFCGFWLEDPEFG